MWIYGYEDRKSYMLGYNPFTTSFTFILFHNTTGLKLIRFVYLSFDSRNFRFSILFFQFFLRGEKLSILWHVRDLCRQRNSLFLAR